VLPIIRHMSINENTLGLGSLWDSEQMNSELDVARERERVRKSGLFFSDAMLALREDDGVSVQATSFDRVVHVRRIGMTWIDGVVCGSVDRVIVPFGAIRVAFSPSDCTCVVSTPDHFELVSLGAVLRDIERHASSITVVGERFGVRGRITGVWRDAITVRSRRRESVLPRSALGVILVEDSERT
jgi:hypothetical protein